MIKKIAYVIDAKRVDTKDDYFMSLIKNPEKGQFDCVYVLYQRKKLKTLFWMNEVFVAVGIEYVPHEYGIQLKQHGFWEYKSAIQTKLEDEKLGFGLYSQTKPDLKRYFEFDFDHLTFKKPGGIYDEIKMEQY